MGGACLRPFEELGHGQASCLPESQNPRPHGWSSTPCAVEGLQGGTFAAVFSGATLGMV